MAEEKLDGFLGELQVPLKAVIDRAVAAQKSPLWFTQYFPFAPKQVSLDFTTIYGEETIEEMAAVINDGSEIPLMGRDAISKLQGEMPTIAIAREMTAKQYRELIQLRALTIQNDQIAFNAILDSIYDDVTTVGTSVLRRINGMALQAVSTGSIIINNDNNPNGVAWTLNLGMPSGNIKKAVGKWSEVATKIVTQIRAIVREFRQKGKLFEKILVSEALFENILKNEEVKDTIKATLNITNVSDIGFLSTEENVNRALRALRLPYFEIVDAVTPVAKDGKKTVVNSWEQDNAVFVPAGALGRVHSAFNNEVLMGQPSVYQYGDFLGVQIMRWHQRRPLTEYTAGEFIGIPGHEQVKNVVIVKTETV